MPGAACYTREERLAGDPGHPWEATPPPAPSSLALLKSVLENEFLRILLERALCCLKIYSKTSTLKHAGARAPIPAGTARAEGVRGVRGGDTRVTRSPRWACP